MTFSTYYAHGLQISSASALRLPEISLGNPQGVKPPNVIIRFGDVPGALLNALTRTPVIQATRREFLFALPGAGRFLVRDGQDVYVHLEMLAADKMMGLHLAHAGMAAVLHQRGLQPLHASGALVDGGCVAFLGAPHAGKSTVAAALKQRGHPVLCDDICAVDFSEGVAAVRPGSGRLQLWADAAQALGLDTASAPRAHPEGERFEFSTALSVNDRPIPLRRLYILQDTRIRPAGFRRLSGAEAFKCLYSYTYFAPHLGGFDAMKAFAAYAAIARTVPIFVWSRPSGLDQLGATIDCLEEHWRLA